MTTDLGYNGIIRMGYDISLSPRVKELLEEGTLDAILDQVSKDVTEELVNSLPGESALRESLYNELHVLSRVRIRLSSVVNDLLMAEE